MHSFKYCPPSVLTDTGNSIGKILSWIKPGSRVLECGCASGYTTKHLKEKLGCDVWIVELDRDSFELAMNYAVDGVCGDLMDYEWTRAFRNLRFDHILFVDVLEHLYDPGFVVARAVACSPMTAKSWSLFLISPTTTLSQNCVLVISTTHRRAF